MSTKQNSQEDHWSADAYQKAAAFVPKLANKVVQWLDASPSDKILDVGCGDGILTLELAKTLTSGFVHGIDSSADMIQAAQKDVMAASLKNCAYEVLDANALLGASALQDSSFDKVFSNAAMHWILARKSRAEHQAFFLGVNNALKTGGSFVFEMGGMGNVAEMRTALLAAVGRRIGLQNARDIDPWFFPDESWTRELLSCPDSGSWTVEKSELEYRPTRMEKGSGGGIEGWVRLMGKQFFDGLGDTHDREECIQEVVENLRTVCTSPAGGEWIGYVRLRVVARKA